MEYTNLPTKEALLIAIDENKKLDEGEYQFCCDMIVELYKPLEDDEVDLQWLIDKTETFCKDAAIYNGIMASIKILEDEKHNSKKEAIPAILQDALGVSFDPNVGHDYMGDSNERFKFYHKKEKHVPFDLEMMNKITNGGIVGKSLTVIMAGTGVGKSLFMCHCAAANMMLGKRVLYITCEMAEEKIAERIDANLLDIDINRLRDLSKEVYDKKI
jgi:predicted ATP-dependent serine protease